LHDRVHEEASGKHALPGLPPPGAEGEGLGGHSPK